ncbi:MAG: endonuclease/exonuclease/phosphatase family protein [Chloroflexi bacterium]|nr:endonuclease/exonuclease/phosphatase family protein [Chloroflexota bacterium]
MLLKLSRLLPLPVTFRIGLVFVLLAIAFPVLTAVPAAAAVPITVMTRNLYFGADLSPVIASPTPANVEATFTKVNTTDFPARAGVLADEIAAAHPHLIGLQEAVLWRTQTPGDILSGNTTPNATVIAYDFVQILLDKLALLGLTYTPVSTVTEFDVELPGIGRDIRLTDRDVILAWTNPPVSTFSLSNNQTGNFTNAGVLVFPIGPVTVKRGWASVDVTMSTGSFRFITTHLESFSSLFPGIQELQGDELLAGPANTILPVILVGDLNSAAAGSGFATPTYGNIIAAGFSDAWSTANPGVSGFTWGQAELLDNASSLLSARIDFVLFRGTFIITMASRVGDAPLPITATVKWPSDHAGIVVAIDTILIPEFPTIISGVAVAGICFVIFYLMRRHKNKLLFGRT